MKNNKDNTDKTDKKSPRLSYIGLLKFLAAVGIVFLHSGKGSDHWGCLWILVEFFFMLTGYFTFRHFQRDQNAIENDDIEQKSTKAIKYTVKKFTSFLPYMIFGIVAFYIAISAFELRHGIESSISSLKTMPFDLLFLNSQLPRGNWAIWFVSAMALVFPIFCIICQTKRPKTLISIMLPFIITYYLRIYDDRIYGFYAYGRAFFGMLAGIYICQLVDYIKTLNFNKAKSILLNIAEWISTIAVVICMYPGSKSSRVEFAKLFAILTIFISLTIILSGKTITSNIRNKLFDFLEKLSMVIYLTHVAVLWFAEIILSEMGAMQYMRIVCVISSVILSVVIYVSIDSITNKRRLSKDKQEQ